MLFSTLTAALVCSSISGMPIPQAGESSAMILHARTGSRSTTLAIDKDKQRRRIERDAECRRKYDEARYPKRKQARKGKLEKKLKANRVSGEEKAKYRAEKMAEDKRLDREQKIWNQTVGKKRQDALQGMVELAKESKLVDGKSPWANPPVERARQFQVPQALRPELARALDSALSGFRLLDLDLVVSRVIYLYEKRTKNSPYD
ncbi:hypothetical protein C8J56DRAFT_1125102 [Mycena floridula]|nr:hypothetical protein C8J56DRAFT_1125102 [Mycena floridula]